MRSLVKYAFANARTRALISFLLSVEDFHRLAQAQGVDGVVEGLKRTPYAETLGDLKNADPVAIEDALIAGDIAVFKKVAAFVTGAESSVLMFLLERYELERLKTILRMRGGSGMSGVRVPAGKIVFDFSPDAVFAADGNDGLLASLKNTPYQEPVARLRRRLAAHALDSGGAPASAPGGGEERSFFLEASLDADYCGRFFVAIGRLTPGDRQAMKRIMVPEMDGDNLRWLWRAGNRFGMEMKDAAMWLLPGGTPALAAGVRSFPQEGFERLCGRLKKYYPGLADAAGDEESLARYFADRQEREVRRVFGGFPFTLGVVAGYLIMKRKETERIRALIHAKAYGWSAAQLQGAGVV